MLALGSRHQRTFLGTLHNVGTASLAHEAAVLEEALVAWKAVCEVLKGQQTQSPDLSSPELALILHAIRTPKDTVAVKPALMEFSFISEII